MREFQERRRLKRFLHSRYAIALLVIICLFMAKGVRGVFDKYERSKQLAERTGRELSGLEAKYKSLSQDTASLATDEGKEREIRDRFPVAKEGEKVIVIVDDADEGDGTEGNTPKSWWDAFLGFFKRD